MLTLSQRFATQVTGIHMNQESSAALCIAGGLVLLCLSLAVVLLRWYRVQLRLAEMLPPPSPVDASYEVKDLDVSGCTTIDVGQDIPQQGAATPVTLEQGSHQHWADAPNPEPESPAPIMKEEEYEDAEELSQAAKRVSQSPHQNPPHH